MSEPMPKDMEELLTKILTDMVKANVELNILKQGYEKITEMIPLRQEWMEKMVGKLERLEQRVEKFMNKALWVENLAADACHAVEELNVRLRRVEAVITGAQVVHALMGEASSGEEEEEEDPPSQ